MRPEPTWFIRGAHFAKKYFFWLLKDNEKTKQKLQRHFPSEYEDLLLFSELEIERYDILLFAYTSAFLSFVCFFVCDLLLLVLDIFFLRQIRWSNNNPDAYRVDCCAVRCDESHRVLPKNLRQIHPDSFAW